MAARAIVHSVFSFMKIDTPTPTDYDDFPIPAQRQNSELHKRYSNGTQGTNRQNNVESRSYVNQPNPHKNDDYHQNQNTTPNRSSRSNAVLPPLCSCSFCINNSLDPINDNNYKEERPYPLTLPHSSFHQSKSQKLPDTFRRMFVTKDNRRSGNSGSEFYNYNDSNGRFNSSSHCGCGKYNGRKGFGCGEPSSSGGNCSSKGKPDLIPKSILKRSHSFTHVSPKQYHYGSAMKPDVIAANSCA
jgi:hypothetical protein